MTVGKVFDRLLFICACAAAVILVVFTVMIDVDVVSRYVFNRPMSGVIDISEYGLLYILFLGSAWLLSQDKHVKIDILLMRLSNKTQHIVNTFSSLIAAVATLLMAVFGWVITLEAIQAHSVLMKAIIVPKYVIFIIIPIGSMLLTIQCVRRAWKYWTTRNATVGETPVVEDDRRTGQARLNTG
ncbi:TRAP transporter small permease [Chloroflexota bacterium]